jgi:hypothetical protein
MAACVAKHVRVSIRKARSFSRSRDHFRNVRSGHWPATFTREHKSSGATTLYLAQRPKLITLDWVNRGNPSFQSPDVEMGPNEINLIPFQVCGFANPQAVPRHHQD